GGRADAGHRGWRAGSRRLHHRTPAVACGLPRRNLHDARTAGACSPRRRGGSPGSGSELPRGGPASAGPPPVRGRAGAPTHNPPAATPRLALLLSEAGDSDDALLGVNKVLSPHADSPEALFLQGVILLNALNRPKDAAAPLRRYLEVAPAGGYRADAQQLLQEAEAAGG